jgi:hypothetical protein
VLDVCDCDIEVLQQTEGLLEALEQLQSELVQQLRQKYGPSSMRNTNIIWSKIGQRISRWERLMRDFENEFGGDKDKFLAFFTYEGRMRKKTQVKTWSRRLLVTEDIPLRDKCVNMEAQAEEYKDEDGLFSDEIWKRKWGVMNKWEIWYELEPEAKNWK